MDTNEDIFDPIKRKKRRGVSIKLFKIWTTVFQFIVNLRLLKKDVEIELIVV